MDRCPRVLGLCLAALSALCVLSLVPPADAFDPHDPSTYPVVGQVYNPDDPTDPNPIHTGLPSPKTGDLVEYKIEDIDQCVGYTCAYADANIGGSRACGGILQAGATVIVQAFDPFVEVGHDVGVYGGYADGCTDHDGGLTIDP